MRNLNPVITSQTFIINHTHDAKISHLFTNSATNTTQTKRKTLEMFEREGKRIWHSPANQKNRIKIQRTKMKKKTKLHEKKKLSQYYNIYYYNILIDQNYKVGYAKST